MFNNMKLLQSIIFCLLFLSLSSCTNRYSNASSQDLAEVKARPVFDQSDKEFKKEQSPERKIIFSAYLSLVVTHPDTANQKIEKLATKFKGYVNQIGTQQTIIRVQSDLLDAALEEI